jgi:hypothetical protein
MEGRGEGEAQGVADPPKNYKATNIMARFTNKKNIFSDVKTL